VYAERGGSPAVVEIGDALGRADGIGLSVGSWADSEDGVLNCDIAGVAAGTAPPGTVVVAWGTAAAASGT
jgi:hypothetical protein